MADVMSRPGEPVADQSTSELVQRATEQVSRLIRDELTLAKAELAEKAKHAGIGVGLFGGAGGVGFYALGTLIAALILVLDLWLPAWAAALIVTGLLLMVAGILAVLGRRQVQRAQPPMPESAAQSVRADVETIKAAAGRGRGANNG